MTLCCQRGGSVAEWLRMVLTLLHIVALLAGLLFYYVGLFMYEDEEGKLQSRIENVWISIHDRARESGSKSAALFGKVAAIVTKTFNAIFGQKIFSARFVGASFCYSFAALFLFGSLMLFVASPLGLFVKQPSQADLIAFQYVAIGFLIAGLLSLLLAILPTLWHSRWAVMLTLLPIIFYMFAFVTMIGLHALNTKRLGAFVGLTLSLISDVLLLTLVRFTLRWVSAKASTWRIASAILTHLAIIYFLILVPFAIPVVLSDDFRQSMVLTALVIMGGLNLFTGLASSAFLLVLLFLLLHRLLWPVLSRIVYPLQRFHVIRNRKIMLSIGTACLLYSAPSLRGPAKALVEWIAK